MIHRRFTLVAEGSSDAVLIPIINWLWTQHRPQEVVTGRFAELPMVDSRLIEDKVGPALELYPCDVLFIHRDADREPVSQRENEIEAAVKKCRITPPAICVVPVRMTEAWMLFDECAIRKAAGNPNGKMRLSLPSLAKAEARPDPKADLRKAVKTASGLSAQRLSRFNASAACRLVSEHIQDFSPLRKLGSFARLEDHFSSLSLK